MNTQTEIYDYLLANPLGVNVAVGDVEDLNGEDYIFFDYLEDELIPYDDRGTYQALIQFTVCTKDFENRKILTDYIKQEFNVSVTYEKSIEFEYYLSRCNCGLLMFSDYEEG